MAINRESVGEKPDPREGLAEIKLLMADFLRSTPSSPEHGTSVRAFCERGINLWNNGASAAWAITTSQPINDLRALVEQPLTESEAFRQGRDTREQFTLEGGRITITPPPEFKFRGMNGFSGIVRTAGDIDLALPRLSYAWVLATPPHPPRPLVFEEQMGKHYGFSNRFHLFREASGFASSATEVRLMALTFLEELAAIKAVGSIKEQIEQFRPQDPSFIAFPPADITQAALYVKRHIAKTQYHLGYLAKIKELRARIQHAAKMDDYQVRLLDDIAFLHRGKLEAGELTELLTPIMKAVGENRYEDAYRMRDFLLNNFFECFPGFRQKYQEGESFAGVNKFIQARLADGRSTTEGVPEEYCNLILNRVEELQLKAGETWIREEAKKEKVRKEALAQELLLQSIKIVAQKKDEQRNRSPKYNPQQPISMENPLILEYCFVPDDLDNVTDVHEWRYDARLGDALLAYRSRFDDNARHYFITVFTSLLYNRLLSETTVREAFETLKKTGVTKDSDSVYDLLSLILQTPMRRLHSNMPTYALVSGNEGRIKQTMEQKLEALESLISSLAPQTS